jgi:cytochrome c551/c552
MKLLIIISLIFSFGINLEATSKKKKVKADPVGKKLFETNCLACHDPLKAVVGPTLHEINKLYETSVEGIVTWAKKPGRKRTEGIAMPPMGHIPDKDLKLIADYMLWAGSRVSRKELRKVNTFKENLGKIQRTFMPDSGVASFAITFTDDLSLCWDAEKATTRYIWQGKIDPKSHFTGNGKVIPALKGEVIYKSSQSLFLGLSAKVDFLGYKVSEQGLPIFYYKKGNAKFTETLSYKNERLSWSYKVSGPNELSLVLPKVAGYKTSASKGALKNGQLILNKQELSHFTITLSKEK